MTKPYRRQDQTGIDPKDNPKGRGLGFEAVVPNPKLKLMDQVREVMRLRHYSMHTERSYCNGILRFIRFHQMKSRAEMAFMAMVRRESKVVSESRRDRRDFMVGSWVSIGGGNGLMD